MNPTELYEKFLGLLITVIAGTVITTFFSWKFLDALIDLIIKEFKQGKKLAAFLTVLTVAGMVSVVVAVGAGIWLGYRYIRPEVVSSEPTKPAEPQATPIPTPTPRGMSGAESTYRTRVNPGRRRPKPSAPETSQPNNAPTTAQTSRPADAAPTAPGQSPQSPATETRPVFTAPQPAAPGCNPNSPPTTIIIPPGEKVPEQDQLV